MKEIYKKIESDQAMKKKERDNLIKAIETHLDTRDKRFMFLKCTTFSRLIPMINLEGNSHCCAVDMYFEFEKQGMGGSLMATMNSIFELDLRITYETN